MITLIAAIALASTAPQASEAQSAVDELKECIAANGLIYGRGSREGADVLADLIIYKCTDGSSKRTAAVRLLPARLMAIDAIVKTRMPQ